MDKVAQQGSYRLRSGVSIQPEQNEALERLTTELLTQVPASFVLLADVAGQVVLAKGNHDAINLVMLGSLVAGDLAASQEVARLTGQYQEYQIVLREGDNFNTFIIEAGHHLALLVQVDREVPLGWARMVIKRTGQHLAEVMATKSGAPDMGRAAETAVYTLTAEEDDDGNDIALSDLFSDALDDLWVEM
jgi:predicted regulator of Ras-like GTPase activity (Roadblock/LC7/MglB family)